MTTHEDAYDAELAQRRELLQYAARLHHEPGETKFNVARLTDADLERLAREVEALHYRVPVSSRALWMLTRGLAHELRVQQAARATAWSGFARAHALPAFDDVAGEET